MARPELRVRFRVRAELAAISRLRARLLGFLGAAGLDLDDRGRMEVALALDEAATNIVRHGYAGQDGVIDVEYENAGGELVIRLWDDAANRIEQDCTGLPPGAVGESGMGTNIMRASLSGLSYERSPDGRNLLVLRRRADHPSWTQPRDGAK